MKRSKIIISLVLLIFPLLYGQVCYGQDSKKTDSIIKVISNQIYDNPDKVIAVGNQIIKESGNNIDDKIKGYKLISDAYSSKRDYQKSLENVIKAEELLDKTSNKLLKISIIIKAGTVIHAYGTFDNTDKNAFNPNHPPKVVTQGEGVRSMQTTEEMFQFIFSYLPYQPGDEKMDLNTH